jgi:hypothetical protein
MSDSHGRFRVRRGELEIEYEGPNLIQEYRAALAYLGFVDGAQTRLEDTGFEALPERAVKAQTAPHLPISLATSPSGMQTTMMESELEKSEVGLESRGLSSQESERSASRSEDANPSHGLLFSVLGRANQDSGRENEHQSTEPKTETYPSLEKITHNSDGAVPGEMLIDGKFKDVLKRLGLAI